ncbi:MAG: hypothetical protein JW860_06915 [Sedimentisphaerales bacterium]|nr:hypothetical protein [Sedimentisphaerales bacterium]
MSMFIGCGEKGKEGLKQSILYVLVLAGLCMVSTLWAQEADIDGGGVRLSDFSIVSENWLVTGCSDLNQWCNGADIMHTTSVGIDDLEIMAIQWLSGGGTGGEYESQKTIYCGESTDDTTGRIWDNGSTGTGLSTTSLRLGDLYSGGTNYQYRNVIAFDTTGELPDDAVIVGAQLELVQSTSVGADPFTWGNDCLIDIASPYFGTTASLAMEDWSAAADAGDVGRFLAAPAGDNQATLSTPLDSTGLSLIETNGTTQFRVYFSPGTNGDTTSDIVDFYSAKDEEDPLEPKLILTFQADRVYEEYTSIADEDGRIYDYNGSEVGENVTNTTGNMALRLGDFETATDTYSYRNILSFDTSTLPDDCIVIGARLKIIRGGSAGGDPFDDMGTCQIDIDSAFSGDTALELTDYEDAAIASNVAQFTSDPGVDKALMTSTEFNAGGLSNINMLGKTQLRVYFSVNNNGNAAADFIGFYSGNDPLYAPQLEVEYVFP